MPSVPPSRYTSDHHIRSHAQSLDDVQSHRADQRSNVEHHSHSQRNHEATGGLSAGGHDLNGRDEHDGHDDHDDGDPLGPTMMTVAQFAEMMMVSKKTIYEAIRTGGLPGVVKIGRRYRINLDAVLTSFRQGHGIPSRKK